MRVFVTGAAGFIGTELVKELIEAGHLVRGLARSDVAAEQLTRAGAQVHDTRKQGMVELLTQMAREKGVSAYVGDGANRWPAAPLTDVVHLYRLAVEQTGPGVTVYHAVQEEGVPMREIAEALGKRLKMPVASIDPDKAVEHFGWFADFGGVDMPASSEWTRKTLSWNPTGPGLIEDMTNTNIPDQLHPAALHEARHSTFERILENAAAISPPSYKDCFSARVNLDV